MRIILYGESGVGKSTVAKDLARYFNLEKISAGDIMREQAENLGISIYEFDQLCKEDPYYDTFLDEKIEEIGKTKDNIILDGRLAWYFVRTGIKIKLTCSNEVILQRISERENISIEEADKKTKDRQEAYIQRYKELYPQINYPPKDEEFDIIHDTTNSTPEKTKKSIIDEIIKKIN